MVHPKPQSLCATVAGHHSALEVDLRREGVELLDLWCGCLSWRQLAQHVRWLDRSALLYRSMMEARPPETGGGKRLALVDPLKAVRGRTTEDLLLLVLNELEMRTCISLDPKTRGEFTPTLPAGYERNDAADVDGREIPAWNSTEAQDALAWMYAQPH